MNEIWKDIGSHYQVSNLGRYKAKECNFIKKGKIYRFKERILTGTINDSGYILVQHGNKQVRLHRLVAEAFIPNPDDKPQVNHINGIKSDNRIENLEWVTHKENMIHANEIKLIDNSGVKNFHSKLCDNSVKLIKLSKYHVYQKDIARFYNVSTSTINDIIKGRTWKHVNI